MANRPGRLAVALAALALLGPPLAAQSDVAAAAEPRDFLLDRDAEGNPVFTQLLRWESSPEALEYRIVLRASGGPDMLDEKCPEAEKEVRLSAGRYEYRITTYNLLGKAEAETDWIGFEVIRAEQPVILASSPRTIYLETLDRRVRLSGSCLLAGGLPLLVAKDGGVIRGRIVQSKGEGELLVEFPAEAYAPGEYGLGFENPGGLSARLENSLILRAPRMLPEFWLSGSGAAAFGLGDLAAWTRGAFGGGCAFEVDRALFQPMSIGVDADYLGYLPSRPEIQSLRQLSLVCLVGYRLAIDPRWTISPRLGAGYGGGFVGDIDGDESGGQLFLVARVEGSWLFLPQWRLNAIAGYRATIEDRAWFSALSLGLSLSWRLPLTVERSWMIR
jgi:hypothetical protein